MTIGYDGTEYCGWQRQKHDTSIQGEIEKRLCRMTNEEIFLHGAGRTDAGVHAEAMVAHFDTASQITDSAFQRGLNSMLPGAIRILKVETCASDFHARFSATGKRYHYHLYRAPVQPAHLRLYSLHITSPLDLEAICSCLSCLEGEHDFSSFENTGTRDKNATGGRGATRTLYHARLLPQEDEHIVLEFIGDGFLKNMVRNMVGTLLEVGRGRISPEQFHGILQQQDRAAAGPTAPAHGLFLKEVFYTQDDKTNNLQP